MDQTDPDETNNRASIILNQDPGSHPIITDLAVLKSVNVSGVDINEDAIFTILVRNNGPDDAENVDLSDSLPEGLTFVVFE